MTSEVYSNDYTHSVFSTFTGSNFTPPNPLNVQTLNASVAVNTNLIGGYTGGNITIDPIGSGRIVLQAQSVNLNRILDLGNGIDITDTSGVGFSVDSGTGPMTLFSESFELLNTGSANIAITDDSNFGIDIIANGSGPVYIGSGNDATLTAVVTAEVSGDTANLVGNTQAEVAGETVLISANTGVGLLSISSNLTTFAGPITINGQTTLYQTALILSSGTGTGRVYLYPYQGGTFTDYSFYFPSTIGSAGAFLTTDGGGNASWATNTSSFTTGTLTVTTITTPTNVNLAISPNGTGIVNVLSNTNFSGDINVTGTVYTQATVLQNAGLNQLQLSPYTSAFTNYYLIFPPNPGTIPGQVLTTDSIGALSWSPAGGLINMAMTSGAFTGTYFLGVKWRVLGDVCYLTFPLDLNANSIGGATDNITGTLPAGVPFPSSTTQLANCWVQDYTIAVGGSFTTLGQAQITTTGLVTFTSSTTVNQWLNSGFNRDLIAGKIIGINAQTITYYVGA
jgi:hypothetical protein